MMENKIKLIILFGPRGSGKDTLKNWASAHLDVNPTISVTTRPPREHEINGKDYYFVDKMKFNQLKDDGQLIEDTEFRGWYYGTPIHTLDINKINIGIFNVAGIRHILKDDRLEVYPIYLECSDKERLLRQLNREDNPDCTEICRRFGTDKKDFSNINFEYSIISTEQNDEDAAGAELMKWINKTFK